MKQLFLSAALLVIGFSNAQIGIGTNSPNISAALDITSTTQGLLPPRMTTTQRDAINSGVAPTGLVIFNTTTNGLEIKSSTGWISLKTSSDAAFLPTIVIGKQHWMRENLDVVTYRNGDIIPQVTDATAWAALTTGAWCYYNNDSANGAIYGKLYNWFAVNDPRGLAPEGWHVPTDAEWTILTDKLGGTTVAGGKMKTTGDTLWATPNESANNESGFTGLPGGYIDRYFNFGSINDSGFWWSSSVGADSSEALSRFLNSDDFEGGFIHSYSWNKKYGFSVRCLRD